MSDLVLRSSLCPKISESESKSDVWSYLKGKVSKALASKPCLENLTWFEDMNTGETILYRELVQKVEGLAVKISQLFGVNPGDGVLIHGPNHALYPLAMFAVLALGGTAVIVPSYLREDMAHEAKEMKASIAIVHNSLLETVESILKDGNVQIVPMEPCERYKTSIRDLVAGGNSVSQQEMDDLAEARKKIDVATQCALLFYSSGTTGKPKPIIRSHQSFICGVETRTPGEPGDVCILTFLFDHVAANAFFQRSASNSFQLKAFSSYVPERDLVAAIREHKATYFSCFPRDLIYMSRYADQPDAQPLPSVTKIGYGGGPTPLAVLEQLKPILPNLTQAIQVYAMTECGVITSTMDIEYRAGSAGKLLAGFELKIVDPETERPLGHNQKGEIYLRSPAMFLKYREPESANGKAFTEDGWFRTGDFGYYDEDEYIYVCNRVVDVIRVSKADGSIRYVPPSTIEEVLYVFPEVKHVAVVGEDIEGSNAQLLDAFVSKQEGADINEQMIMDAVKAEFRDQPEMHLNRVFFVDDLPMTRAGKIYRLALRKKYNLQKN